MSTMSQKIFNKECLESKSIIIGDLDGYYGDPLEWESVTNNLVEYAIFYSDSCNLWLEAVLLFNYGTKKFGEKFLLPQTNAKINKQEFKRHHYGLLKQYEIDRTTVKLILYGEVDQKCLQEATGYHYAGLKEYEYQNETEILSEVDNETILSIFVPQMLVNKLFGVDYSVILDCIDPKLKSPEKIWMYAWRLLYRLYSNDLIDIEKSWNDLLNEWKSCFIKADFHGFKHSCFVIIYYLYCHAIKRVFDIKDLTQQIIKS